MKASAAPVAPAAPENIEAAEEAGLHYVTERDEGIFRKRRGHGFYYVDADGKPVRKPETKLRIKSLVIPPAWEDVWICADERGHVQATGTDQRGRRQYIYHPRWREVRDQDKYERMIDFGRALPRIRRRLRRDLRRPGLTFEKVIATVVTLLEKSLIRVGNDEYARENHSFGLTTLRNRHVKVRGAEIHFQFAGKSGVEHAIDLHDKRLARIIKACQDLPGQQLFQYADDDGELHRIRSDDVNAYLKEISGHDFTAKDFRTWNGTCLAAAALQKLEAFESQREAKKNITAAIADVAKKLGNTRAVCRKCYVHPRVLASYLEGNLVEELTGNTPAASKQVTALRAEEKAVLHLLQSRKVRRSEKIRLVK